MTLDYVTSVIPCDINH